MIEPVTFTVAGKPETQGSKQPFVPQYGDGRPVRRHKNGCAAKDEPTLAKDGFECKCPIMANTVEDNKDALDAWRAAVGFTARAAMRSRPLLEGLVVAQFLFVRPRPKAHYGTGRNERMLKDSAPAAPATTPDVLKLARAVEDALTGVVYIDDSQIVDEVIAKRYCHRWEEWRVEVEIRMAAAQTVGDLVAGGMLDLPLLNASHPGQLTLAVA
jgi:Holliday junction resolvase RusA-like endonuclease